MTRPATFYWFNRGTGVTAAQRAELMAVMAVMGGERPAVAEPAPPALGAIRGTLPTDWPCVYCAAAPGQWCRTLTSDRATKRSHMDRQRAVGLFARYGSRSERVVHIGARRA